MLKKGSLMMLAAAATLAAVLALWMTAERQAVTETTVDGALLEGFKDQINEVTRVVVRSADSTVTLERGDTEWTVAERAGYPANVQNLRKQLLALAESELLERKTSNPDNYSIIGVEDVADGAKSTELTLEGLDQPMTLIVGNQNLQGQAATYVRRLGETASWLASGNLRMDAEVTAWLRKDVLNVSSARLRRVQLTHADGSQLNLVKNAKADPNFLLLDLPEGRELSSPSAGNTVASSLGSLRLDDVVPAEDTDQEGREVVRGVFETFDGLRIHTEAWAVDADRFVALSVEFDASLVPETAPSEPAEPSGSSGDDVPELQDPSPAEEDAEEETESAADEPDVSTEAETLSRVVSGWVFKIPSYKYNNMTKTLEDLLKPLETVDETAGP